VAISKWEAKAERVSKALSKLKDATLGNVVHVRHDVEAVAAATMIGAVRGAFEAQGKSFDIPGPGGVKIPPELVIGTLVIGIGAADAASNRMSETAADFHAAGSGVLAAGAHNMAREFMKGRGKVAA